MTFSKDGGDRPIDNFAAVAAEQSAEIAKKEWQNRTNCHIFANQIAKQKGAFPLLFLKLVSYNSELLIRRPYHA